MNQEMIDNLVTNMHVYMNVGIKAHCCKRNSWREPRLELKGHLKAQDKTRKN